MFAFSLPKHILSVSLRLLHDDDVTAILRGIEWTEELPDASPLHRMAERLLHLERLALGDEIAWLRPTSLSVKLERLSVLCIWVAGPSLVPRNDRNGRPVERRCTIHIGPRRPDEEAFIQGHRNAISYEGEASAVLRAHLVALVAQLDVYPFKALRDRFLRQILGDNTTSP